MLTVQKAEPILLTLLHIQRKYKKPYSYPAQLTICANMGTYRRVKKSRPTLNRWLRVLEDEGYIKRIRRIRKTKEHGLEFNSTMYFLLMKGLKLLQILGFNVSNEISAFIARLKYKYPEFAARSIKKVLDTTKKNPRHEEFMVGIVDKLEKRHVIA